MQLEVKLINPGVVGHFSHSGIAAPAVPLLERAWMDKSGGAS
jgi:hypothetical protein